MPESQDKSRCIEFRIPVPYVVSVAEFAPYEQASQLLAVGTNSRVCVYRCRFKNEDEDVEDFDYKLICDFENGSRVTALAWSPSSTMNAVPRVLKFAVAGSDKQIKVFSTDLKGNDSDKIIKGHTGYINSLVFDPMGGEQLASTGDDMTCRLWGPEGDQALCFNLGAPGMSVCWHPEEPMKIVVGLKDGVIKMFSLTGQQQIMSFDCGGQMPLKELDWCHGNSLLIGAAAGPDWFVFDTSVASHCIDKRQGHLEGIRHLRWCKCKDNLVATVGRPDGQVRVYNTKQQQIPVTVTQQVAYGMSWHLSLPILAVGGDQKVHLYMLDAV
ncbi:hypothetical protein ACJMK2_006671 [Sinanodonta woodiana]|uniref:Nucleoporin Nup37 n=1 Tax=Sinanodonta woodiana TaxID=1069815 RepID=A0ABD3VVH9_SINWO